MAASAWPEKKKAEMAKSKDVVVTGVSTSNLTKTNK
jgi:hypothetical protein